MTLQFLFTLVLAVLAGATIIGQGMRLASTSEQTKAVLANVNVRIATWWVLCGLMGAALLLGDAAIIVLFAVFSALALREFIRLIPEHRGDHRALFWSLIIFTPLQYWAIWSRSYILFTALIPVFAFLFVPVRSAIAGSTNQFWERTAKIQWALMICTYCLSYAPALLMLDIAGYSGRNSTLLFYLLIVVQFSDVMQYVWGKLLGRRRIAPNISPGKTWEGFLGGALTSTAAGTALYAATPFQPLQAAGVCAIVTLAGFAGDLTLSAIKRDHGIKDYGSLIAGHGGVLDRADSLCFAAPVFYYLTRYFCIR